MIKIEEEKIEVTGEVATILTELVYGTQVILEKINLPKNVKKSVVAKVVASYYDSIDELKKDLDTLEIVTEIYKEKTGSATVEDEKLC